MIRKLSIVFLIQVICIASVFAGSKKIAGAQFLKLGLGARASAMGGAYTGVSDEANAVYWNPAGLVQMAGKSELTLMHAMWFEDISFNYAAYCIKALGGIIGIGVNNVSSGDIKEYDNLGINLNKTYSATDMSAALSYAFKVNEKISIGLNAKQISSKIEKEQSSSLAADIGAFLKASEKLRLGFSAQNYGTEIKFRNTSEQLPQIMRLGLSYKMRDLLLSLDGVSASDDDVDARAGFEYTPPFASNFSLRAGYKSRAAADFTAMAGITAGFGASFGGYSIDYAMDSFGDLGYTHMISLGVKFGLEQAKAPVRETKEDKKAAVMKKDVKAKMLNVGVIDFQALAPISMSEATFTTEIFRAALVQQKKYKIVDRNNMEKVLAEQGFQQTGCTTNECAVQMGKLLNVNKIISGTFGKLGQHYLLTINVLDVETGEIIHSDKASCKELTPDDVQSMTNGLIQKLIKEVE